MTIPHIGLAEEDLSSSHKGSEFRFRYTVVRHFSSGDERIEEVIPVPDSFVKAFLIGFFTCITDLVGH